MLGQVQPFAPYGYSVESFSNTGNPVAGDGVAILVKQDAPYMRLSLNTTLQTIACRFGLVRPTTIWNLYINPGEHVTQNNISDLIAQLPEPIILLGDFNCRSSM